VHTLYNTAPLPPATPRTPPTHHHAHPAPALFSRVSHTTRTPPRLPLPTHTSPACADDCPHCGAGWTSRTRLGATYKKGTLAAEKSLLPSSPPPPPPRDFMPCARQLASPLPVPAGNSAIKLSSSSPPAATHIDNAFHASVVKISACQIGIGLAHAAWRAPAARVTGGTRILRTSARNWRARHRKKGTFLLRLVGWRGRAGACTPPGAVSFTPASPRHHTHAATRHGFCAHAPHLP